MKKIGFANVICASAHPADWNKIAEIYSLDSDFIVPAFGVHPWYVKQVNHDWENNLIKLLKAVNLEPKQRFFLPKSCK